MYKNPKVLAISFAYPPLAYPRSIQVARLLKHLHLSTVLVCGDEQDVPKDPTIEPYSESYLKECLRVTFPLSGRLSLIEKIAYRFLPLWNKLPDRYRSWKPLVLGTVEEFISINRDVPDILITFGQPNTDHLIGLEIKRRYRLPWIAHFSDPWVDNPFRYDDPLTTWLNRRMERQVIKNADAVIFTSAETSELVMRKYPVSWQEKSFCVSHCYDRTLYDTSLMPSRECYVLRYVGNFYGHRSPNPFFKAIEQIGRETPGLLEAVSFEFVGSLNSSIINSYPSIKQKVSFTGPVSYAESLRLMQTAHCLLVIDAPGDLSVFFPSKLVDYIGANRFILAVSPPGTTAGVVKEVGGTVADPSNIQAIVDALRKVLEQKPEKLSSPTNRYDKEIVAKEMMEIIEMIGAKG